MRRTLAAVLGCLCAATAAAQAPGPPDTAALLAAQREAMRPLAVLDGIWRGTATVVLPDGSRRELVQTERAGAMLDGTLRVIEGRGYAADGKVEFNAFGVLSYSPHTQRHSLRAYARGQQGDYPVELRNDGFDWTQRHGPVTIRHSATIRDGTWTETSEYVVEGRPPVRTFEMKLRRVGDADWPAGGAVPPR